MTFDLVLGVFIVAIGVFTLVARLLNKEVIASAEPMKARFGARAGAALHFGVYTILPMVLGGALIFLNLTFG